MGGCSVGPFTKGIPVGPLNFGDGASARRKKNETTRIITRVAKKHRKNMDIFFMCLPTSLVYPKNGKNKDPYSTVTDFVRFLGQRCDEYAYALQAGGRIK